MKVKAVFGDGKLVKVHPRPEERCNLDDAKGVRELSLGELIDAVLDTITIDDSGAEWSDDFDAKEFDEEMVCEWCGAGG